MTTQFILTDEPAPYGTRFRYVSEGTCHGPILGQSSIQGNRTHPNITCIGNFPDGHEAILLVSLVSDVSRHPLGYGMHGHTFFGKNVFNGQYIVHLKASNSKISHQLQGVTVIHTKSSDKNDILSGKYIQDMILLKEGIFNYSRLMQKFNSTSTNKQLNLEWFKSQYPEFVAESKIAASNVQYLANQVRLKFDLFIQDVYTRTYSNPPETIISQVVHNTRDKEHKPLHIHRSSRTSGSPMGGDEIFLFCDEFIPKDLEIVFFFDKYPGQIIGNGDFSPSDIHNKCGIVFTTPRLSIIIDDPLRASYCLKRGDMMSNCFEYVFFPHSSIQGHMLNNFESAFPNSESKFNRLTSINWRSDASISHLHGILPNVLPNSLTNQLTHNSNRNDPQEVPMESEIMSCLNEPVYNNFTLNTHSSDTQNHSALEYSNDTQLSHYISGLESQHQPLSNALYSNSDPSSVSPQFYAMYQNSPNSNFSSESNVSQRSVPRQF